MMFRVSKTPIEKLRENAYEYGEIKGEIKTLERVLREIDNNDCLTMEEFREKIEALLTEAKYEDN